MYAIHIYIYKAFYYCHCGKPYILLIYDYQIKTLYKKIYSIQYESVSLYCKPTITACSTELWITMACLYICWSCVYNQIRFSISLLPRVQTDKLQAKYYMNVRHLIAKLQKIFSYYLISYMHHLYIYIANVPVFNSTVPSAMTYGK